MNWHDLIGQTITAISAQLGDAFIQIHTTHGGVCALHETDCCESVDLVRVDGDTEVLVGAVVTVAEDDTGCTPPEWGEKCGDGESVTWTKLTLGTASASVHFWVRGSSNGFYCETLAFKAVEGSVR